MRQWNSTRALSVFLCVFCVSCATYEPFYSESVKNWQDETPEAKARWFQSLPLSERMELLCAYTDLAVTLNPRVLDAKDAQQTDRRVTVLKRT